MMEDARVSDDKYLTKLAALLRQAESTSNEHEAEAFMAAAQRLATATITLGSTDAIGGNTGGEGGERGDRGERGGRGGKRGGRGGRGGGQPREPREPREE